MIDFRYHLVSLISVFLALSVGIVLGAGPLRENLGDQLTGQVEQLRDEQDELRLQAEELAARNDELSTLVGELGPQLVADALPGADIVVLSDDSTLRPPLEKMTALLETAGAGSVTGIELQPTLWEPGEEQRRAEAVDEISEIAPAVLDAALDDGEQLAGAVVTLLSAPRDDELSEDLRSQVWQVLIDQQLVTFVGDEPPTADAVVFASAAPQELAEDSDDDSAAAARAQSLLSTQTALLTRLTATSLPAVVAGVTPDNDGTEGILRTVRGDSGYQSLSTTDRLGEPDGPLLAVLALIEQTHGGTGSYGTTTDAQARVPDLPATSLGNEVSEDSTDSEESADSEDGAAPEEAAEPDDPSGDDAAAQEGGDPAISDGGGEG